MCSQSVMCLREFGNSLGSFLADLLRFFYKFIFKKKGVLEKLIKCRLIRVSRREEERLVRQGQKEQWGCTKQELEYWFFILGAFWWVQDFQFFLLFLFKGQVGDYEEDKGVKEVVIYFGELGVVGGFILFVKCFFLYLVLGVD